MINHQSDKTSYCFATAFQHATGSAPNARTSDDCKKWEIYHKCLVVFFSSFRRVYPNAHLVLVTDRYLPEHYTVLLDKLCVDQKIIDVTDTTLKTSFAGCLFTLSVLEHFQSVLDINKDDMLVLLDPDCIIRSDISAFLQTLGNNHVAALKIDYSLNQYINGHTRASLTLMYSGITGKQYEKPITFYGGEFYAFPSTLLRHVKERIIKIRKWAELHCEKFGDQITEEHILSLVLNELQDDCVIDAAPVIKRIWTAWIYRNVSGVERTLPIWHLPAEKKRGIIKLYNDLNSRGSFQTLSQDDFDSLLFHRIPIAHGIRTNVFLRSLYVCIRHLQAMPELIGSVMRGKT